MTSGRVEPILQRVIRNASTIYTLYPMQHSAGDGTGIAALKCARRNIQENSTYRMMVLPVYRLVVRLFHFTVLINDIQTSNASFERTQFH